jgi:hypothetical protein
VVSWRKVFPGVKADRTVIVFGVFLFLVGLAVAWNGYGYVQIERGWTLVISGTIAFCTGLTLIALGLVLRQLGEIASSAAKSTLFLAKAKSSAQWTPEATEPSRAEAPVLREPEPEDETPEDEGEDVPLAPFVAGNESSGAEARWPDWAETEKPAPAPPPSVESFSSKPPVWMTRAGSYVSTYAAARTVETPETSTKPSAEKPSPEKPWLEEAFLDEPSGDASPVDKPSIEESDDWLEKAIAQEAAVAEEEYENETRKAHPHEHPVHDLHHESDAEAAPFGPPHREQEPEGRDWHEPEAEVEPEPAAEPVWETRRVEPEPAHEPEPAQEHIPHIPDASPEHQPEPDLAPEPEPEPDLRPAVIGSYEAHGTHYTMYADGSIDAETAHGVYRFASMEELKRFIEKS